MAQNSSQVINDVYPSIDTIIPQRSLIDLESHSNGEFGFTDEFILTGLLDDILLVEYIDEINDSAGSVIKRGSLYLSLANTVKCWRKGKVILAGPHARQCKVGDIVVFPSDKGASVSGVQVEGYGMLQKGMFLNEQRIFGICKRNESFPIISKE